MAEVGTARARAFWLVGILFTIFVGVTVVEHLYVSRVEARDRARFEQIQREQDEDMCRMLAALLPDPAKGAPSSSYGQAQREAVAAYRAHRC